jgi:hypothetical protein
MVFMSPELASLLNRSTEINRPLARALARLHVFDRDVRLSFGQVANLIRQDFKRDRGAVVRVLMHDELSHVALVCLLTRQVAYIDNLNSQLRRLRWSGFGRVYIKEFDKESGPSPPIMLELH